MSEGSALFLISEGFFIVFKLSTILKPPSEGLEELLKKTTCLF